MSFLLTRISVSWLYMMMLWLTHFKFPSTAFTAHWQQCQTMLLARASSTTSTSGGPHTSTTSHHNQFNTVGRRADEHLIVLSHGLMGTSKDLTYLANQLQRRGFIVLKSQANELFKTYLGIESGSKRLAEEVYAWKQQHPQLQRISFVGNSMGGL